MLHLMALRVTPASRSQGPPWRLSFGSHRGGPGQPLLVVLAGSTGQERNRRYCPEARAQSGKAAALSLSLASLPCPSLLFAISHSHGEGKQTPDLARGVCCNSNRQGPGIPGTETEAGEVEGSSCP